MSLFFIDDSDLEPADRGRVIRALSLPSSVGIDDSFTSALSPADLREAAERFAGLDPSEDATLACTLRTADDIWITWANVVICGIQSTDPLGVWLVHVEEELQRLWAICNAIADQRLTLDATALGTLRWRVHRLGRGTATMSDAQRTVVERLVETSRLMPQLHAAEATLL